MRLLILGGTGFLGRHLLAAAQKRGHGVTLFNRGTCTDVFVGVDQLHGNRLHGDLGALAGKTWDAAIDTNGYVPSRVTAAAQCLDRVVSHYTYISSLSAYADDAPAPVAESAPVASITPGELARAEAIVPEDPLISDAYGDLYGGLKAACEAAIAETVGDRALIVRPGLIVGPHDPSDRFTYWPSRIARGGEVLAPGGPHRPLQLIDARDLAEWILRLVERRLTGTFNAVGPVAPFTIGALLDEMRVVTGSDARLTWVDDDFLFNAGLVPWTELSLWVPAMYATTPAIAADCNKALAAGLTLRPLAETICDTLDWDLGRPIDQPRRAGLAPARERNLLRDWHGTGR